MSRLASYRPSPATQTANARVHSRRALAFQAGLIVWLLLHAVFALLVWRSPLLGTLYGGVTLGLAAWVGLRRSPAEALCLAAYIAGTEVLWRMSRAQLPWEIGKYGVVMVLGLSLLRRREPLQLPLAPLLFMAVLLPSAALTLMHPDVAEPWEAIRFNLSGPLSLAVAAIFCSVHRFTAAELERVLMALLGPLLGIAAITVIATYGGEPITFTTESNFTTSGGFGPNQVSTILGLGALLSILLLITARTNSLGTVILATLLGLFAVQSAMTFSRGGLYAAFGATAAGLVFLARDRRARLRILFGTVVLTVVAQTLVLPRLEEVTAGALQARFREAASTGRMDLLVADLRLAEESPLFGVGPGIAAYERETLRGWTAAHTELSRLVSEHGAFGILAILLLVAIAVRTVHSARRPRIRMTVTALMVWSAITMMHSAMRLAAPGLIVGLALAASGVRLRAFGAAVTPGTREDAP